MALWATEAMGFSGKFQSLNYFRFQFGQKYFLI